MAIRTIEPSRKTNQFVIADALAQGDAARIRELIRACADGTHVMVDVRFAPSCHALALQVLSEARSMAAGSPEFVGLGAGDRRRLRYLDAS